MTCLSETCFNTLCIYHVLLDHLSIAVTLIQCMREQFVSPEARAGLMILAYSGKCLITENDWCAFSNAYNYKLVTEYVSLQSKANIYPQQHQCLR